MFKFHLSEQTKKATDIKVGDVIRVCSNWATINKIEKFSTGFIFHYDKEILTHKSCFVGYNERLHFADYTIDLEPFIKESLTKISQIELKYCN